MNLVKGVCMAFVGGALMGYTATSAIISVCEIVQEHQRKKEAEEWKEKFDESMKENIVVMNEVMRSSKRN